MLVCVYGRVAAAVRRVLCDASLRWRRRWQLLTAPLVRAARHAPRTLHIDPTTELLTRSATYCGLGRSDGRVGGGPRCGRCPAPAPPPPCGTRAHRYCLVQHTHSSVQTRRLRPSKYIDRTGGLARVSCDIVSNSFPIEFRQ